MEEDEVILNRYHGEAQKAYYNYVECSATPSINGLITL